MRNLIWQSLFKESSGMKKFFIGVLIVAVIGVGVFFYWQRQQSQAQATNTYQTVKLTMGDLTATVGATGTVRTNQTTMVNWQASGRIGKILVKEGDKVTTNQVLAELDLSSLPQNVILAKSDLVTAQRNLDNLKNSDTAKAQAQETLAKAQQALKDAQDARYQKNLARVEQTTIDQKNADLIIAQDALKTAQDNYAKVENRGDADVIRANRFSALAAAQAKLDQIKYDLAYLNSRPDVNEVAQADAAILVAKSKLADAQREWDRLKNGADPQDIAAAQAKIDSIQSLLAQVQIKSPINGTVTDVKSMVGDQVSASTVSFRIDDTTRLLIDVPVPEVDINRVKIGQNAKLTFDAISGKEYKGKVVDVSTFGTASAGVVNFTVTVELTELDDQVRSGMTAAVNLTVEQLTNVLTVPNRAVRLQDGKHIIYILENNAPKPVEVTLGSTADTNTQILRGDVKAGDEVILNPPSAALTAPAAAGGGPFGAGR
jgi:HlyD family secretion protein